MAAKDLIHDAVKEALKKDGWTITHDFYQIKFGNDILYADLAAERPFVAVRDKQKIIVEVKSFAGPSVIQDFKEALGQYMFYKLLLTQTAPEYKLYLAVSDVAYRYDLQRKSIQFVLEERQIPLLVVDVLRQEVVQWIK